MVGLEEMKVLNRCVVYFTKSSNFQRSRPSHTGARAGHPTSSRPSEGGRRALAATALRVNVALAGGQTHGKRPVLGGDVTRAYELCEALLLSLSAMTATESKH